MWFVDVVCGCGLWVWFVDCGCGAKGWASHVREYRSRIMISPTRLTSMDREYDETIRYISALKHMDRCYFLASTGLRFDEFQH